MPTAPPQAISGVSPSTETEIMFVYPSVAATGLGRLLGRLYDSIPLGNLPVRLSHLLFVLPTAPLAAVVYFWLKIFGQRYSLTNREVKIWKMLLGSPQRTLVRVPLAEVAEVEIEEQPGQPFYRAADLVLHSATGDGLARLDGVQRPAVFRQCILKARDAHLQVKSSLDIINARHSS